MASGIKGKIRHCAVPGCRSKKYYAKGLCATHYSSEIKRRKRITEEPDYVPFCKKRISGHETSKISSLKHRQRRRGAQPPKPINIPKESAENVAKEFNFIKDKKAFALNGVLLENRLKKLCGAKVV